MSIYVNGSYIHMVYMPPLPAQPIINPLMAEHGIKSLSHILMKHLTGLGEDWPMYCKLAMLVYRLVSYP